MFFEHICIATDGSDVAYRAAQMAMVLARSGAGRVLALSVAQALDADRDAGQASASGHVAKVARLAHAAGVACDSMTAAASSPGPEIVRVAEENGCDLIVMGTHGVNEMNRDIAGSVAQYVLAHAAVPVLVLRDPREAAPPEA